MAEKEYIERETAITEFDKGDLLVGDNAKWAKEILYRTPTADVVEVKHGEWTYLGSDGNDMPMFRCNKCGRKQFGISKFCASCGAKMKRVIK